MKDSYVFGRFFARGTPDIDGDGVGDIYVADYGSERGGGNKGNATGTPAKGTGTAYVFSGATGEAIHVIEGEVEGEGLGPGRAIPDVDGDGVADLLIAAYGSSEGAPAAGTVRIYSGADASILRTITSTTASEFLGVDALGVGDLNGDGLVDYLLTGFGSDYIIAGSDLS